MKYYVIKKISDVTQSQFNAANVRNAEGIRRCLNNENCVLKFETKNSEYFMDEVWLTYDQISSAMLGEDWDVEKAKPSFWSGVKGLFAVKKTS